MRITIAALFLFLSFALHAQQPPPQYEFRAVWIATVENIDWPSRKGLSTEQQKAEFIKLLDLHQRNGMNAVVMQIRPAADAFYPSQLEPWSEYLTGAQGLAPNPYYDPLQFMIEETHKRGMEFHAWLNPYRAVNNIHGSSISPTHITNMFPQFFLTYGGKKYFDPALPQVREHVCRVVKDVVKRYDVDAIHFDDYFYPYPEGSQAFPDELSYLKYGNGMSKADWRRSNVDSIIKMLSDTIKKVNPRVKFGISPFGVWRNKRNDERGSTSKSTLSNYDDLYADILLWLQKGWIDYVAPQLYWETTYKYLEFNMLLDWWAQHTYGRQLFIGHGIYRTFERNMAWKNPNEIPKQIRALRANTNVLGSVFFSSNTFSSNPRGWNDTLRNNYYKYPALVPPMRWIDSISPLPPLVEKLKSDDKVRLFYRGAEPIKSFAVYALSGNEVEDINNALLVKIIVADKTADILLSSIPGKEDDKIFVATVDRNNNVSDWVRLK